jgi:malonate transporter and related proteins
VSVALLLVPDFLLIVGGVLLKRAGGFGVPFWSGVERLVYFALFPALLFRSLAHAPLPLGDAGPFVAVGLAFTLAGMALSALAQPLFGLPRATFAACFQCGFRFNTYIALAAASRIAGETGLAMISLLVGVLVPAVNFAAVGMLARGHRGRIVLELARNPLVLACLAGFAWRLAGWPLPGVAAHLLELLGNAALPLGLLAVGAGLTLARGTLPLPALAWWHGVKLAALPAIAFALGHVMGLSPLERQIAVVMAAVPTAPTAYILAMQMGGHGAPVAVLISSGTLLAAVTLPLWIALAGSMPGS